MSILPHVYRWCDQALTLCSVCSIVCFYGLTCTLPVNPRQMAVRACGRLGDGAKFWVSEGNGSNKARTTGEAPEIAPLRRCVNLDPTVTTAALMVPQPQGWCLRSRAEGRSCCFSTPYCRHHKTVQLFLSPRRGLDGQQWPPLAPSGSRSGTCIRLVLREAYTVTQSVEPLNEGERT